MTAVIRLWLRLGRWLQGFSGGSARQGASAWWRFGRSIEAYAELCLDHPDFTRLALGLFLSQVTRWTMSISLFFLVVRSSGGGLLALLVLMFGRIVPGLPVVGSASTKAIARFGLRPVASGSILVTIVVPWVFVLFNLLNPVLGNWLYVVLVAANRVVDAVAREYTANAVAGMRRSILPTHEQAAQAIKLDGLLAGLARGMGAGLALAVGLALGDRPSDLNLQIPYVLASLGNVAYAILVWRVGRGITLETSMAKEVGFRPRKSLLAEFIGNWRYASSFPGLMPMILTLMISAASVWAFGELFSKASTAYPEKPGLGLALVSFWLIWAGLGQSLGGTFPPRTNAGYVLVVLAGIPFSLLVVWVNSPLVVGALYGLCSYLIFASDNRCNIEVLNHRDWSGFTPEERGLLVARIMSVKQMCYELSQALLVIPTLLRDRVPSPFPMSHGATRMMWMAGWALLGFVVVVLFTISHRRALSEIRFTAPASGEDRTSRHREPRR